MAKSSPRQADPSRGSLSGSSGDSNNSSSSSAVALAPIAGGDASVTEASRRCAARWACCAPLRTPAVREARIAQSKHASRHAAPARSVNQYTRLRPMLVCAAAASSSAPPRAIQMVRCSRSPAPTATTPPRPAIAICHSEPPKPSHGGTTRTDASRSSPLANETIFVKITCASPNDALTNDPPTNGPWMAKRPTATNITAHAARPKSTITGTATHRPATRERKKANPQMHAPRPASPSANWAPAKESRT